MSVYIFTGPTISAWDAAKELKATYLPPAAEGDAYRVSLKYPRAIGIIDGYFQSVPTVRHKEILWAMSRGIHVFGSASIGALRAAELAAFGMEGVGTIFEMYRDGVLEDDDEVAVAHGPAEVGFLAGSEAMINIRQTLHRAERAGVISQKLRVALEKIGKDLFYPERNYSALLDRAAKSGLPETTLQQFQSWLQTGRVDQKREDALAMLRLIRTRLANGLARKKVTYCFEYTAMWESASRASGELRIGADNNFDKTNLESVLDELRLRAEQVTHAASAHERVLAIREAYRLGMRVTTELRKEAELIFREERDLIEDAKFEAWMKSNNLNDDDFEALMMDEARVRWIRELTRSVALDYLPQELRFSGLYPRLFERAAAKERFIESYGRQNLSLENANLTEAELLQWYFEKCLGRPMPIDLADYSRDAGFADYDGFRRALLKEYLFSHHTLKSENAT